MLHSHSFAAPIARFKAKRISSNGGLCSAKTLNCRAAWRMNKSTPVTTLQPFCRASLTSTDASMGAEDFSCYLQEIPGALLRLGAWDGASDKTALHSAYFTLDEQSIEIGVRAGVASLLGLLASP